MEDADQVLAVRGVDAGLAADGGIDLRQQRGRHLHEIHAAPHDAGGEAGEIADDAAAERDHHVAALQPRRQHAVDHLLQMRQSSWSFRRPAARPEPRRCLPPPRPAVSVSRWRGGDVVVGDDRGARAGQAAAISRAGARQQARADQNVVGALAKRRP